MSFTNRELISEIGNRADGIVLGMIPKGQAEGDTILMHHGHYVLKLGLVEAVARALDEYLADKAQEASDNDDDQD